MAQIGVDLGSYVFNAATGTITFVGVSITSIEQIKPIVNGTRQTVIFNPAESGKFGVLSNNVLTLDFNTTSYSNSDKLYICVNNLKKQDFNKDAFGRTRVSEQNPLLDAQFTYGLQPLVFEQIATGTGATVTHDATNRCALMTFASTGANGNAMMQSFNFFRYQAGKSQEIFISFNFIESIAGVRKIAGYSSGLNGIEFNSINGVHSLRILNGGTEGGEEVIQSNWNLNTYNSLDISKTQLMVIDFQALYVGLVRVGFEWKGQIIYVHQFEHANNFAYPYLQSANLPVRCGMIRESGTVSTTMRFICATVSSEGGVLEQAGLNNITPLVGVTASNGARTHVLSVRPRTTFNGITNRTRLYSLSVEVNDTGNSPVEWELCIGQAITGASYSNVNTNHSAFEYSSAGTLSGTPTIQIDGGLVLAAGKSLKGTTTSNTDIRIPITLDAAGNVRANGTLTLVVKGLGGNSACYCNMQWQEIY